MPDWRQRYLHVRNRLEELAAKHGPLAEDEPPEPVLVRPTWGGLGSLARRELGPEAFERVLREHRALVDQERARLGKPLPPPPPTPDLGPQGPGW